jgi:cysteinyl-tRNA synthetase
MSKSLGNFFTIRDRARSSLMPKSCAFFILRAHYRSALNYSDAHLDDAKRSLDSLYFALRDVPPALVAKLIGTTILPHVLPQR